MYHLRKHLIIHYLCPITPLTYSGVKLKCPDSVRELNFTLLPITRNSAIQDDCCKQMAARLWHFSGYIDEELRHVRKVMNERPLFLPIGGKAPHPLLLPLGNVKIAVGANGEPGRGVELSVDHRSRLELALRRRGRQVQREDAAAARGADVERLAVQDQVHGRLEPAPRDAGH